jgi:LysR family transcriptional regulator for metE and metH
MVAVVPDCHDWARKKFVTAKDFADQNLIIHSLPLETVTVYQFVLAPAGVMPAKITTLPLTEAAIEMVKADMGIMVMAQWALEPYLHSDALKTIRIGRKGLKRTHYAAILKNIHHPEYFDRFVEFLQREISV